ncbi:acetylpolyamine amidohydrolase [Alsobacter metallidurans]|uniref:Acetylpolyamine amidohydrolase n=1 Tax=Alsobacter metallidurans TaxID=340221 RepID=A0A917I7Y8_9HYPH|nr:histone deacetylase family protein [Alsobacter metallidurans]GGH20700.1 acetylpolyamine amidohydrolase [Alsobacter metallidurans]
MKAFFHPAQRLHEPRQFMRSGVISDPKDVADRVAPLLAALGRHGVSVTEPADYGVKLALSVHSPAYVEFLRSAFERWSALPNAGPEVLPNVFPYWNGDPGRAGRPPCPSPSIIAQAGWYMGDLAVPIGPHTWRSALASTHTAVAAADAALDGERYAYALCRPSGHHSRGDRASGFCYLNNSAIAAERLRGRYGKVAVLDVDAHHGDGTQEIFYRRDDVLTVSVHVDPQGYYPFFTGYEHETGHGAGEGFNRNLPLAVGSGDAAFLAAVDAGIKAVTTFGAQALVLALGYDGHKDDPITALTLTTGVYRAIGERIAPLGLPTVVVQEGGYQVSVIGDCLDAFLAGLSA